jgi:hypothetical protein
MSANKPTRRRIDGHPGIYKIGERFQARYRDGATGTVVSRNFPSLEAAEAFKAAQVGFTYTVLAYDGAEFVDAFPITPPDDDEIAAAAEELDASVADIDPDGPAPTPQEHRQYALYLAIKQAAAEALGEMLTDSERVDDVIEGGRRVASLTIKVSRGRADEVMDPAVARYHNRVRKGAQP